MLLRPAAMKCLTSCLLLLLYGVWALSGVAEGQRATTCPTRPIKRAESEKLEQLRGKMTMAIAGKTMEAYIITSDDEHQSEYVADRDKRLQYITGFTGRRGIAAVTKNSAALWAYPEEFWIAEMDLDCDWQIYRIGDDNMTITTWLRKELRTGVRVGADSKLIPAAKWEEWRRELEWSHIPLQETPTNWIDEIWTIGRPPYSNQTAFFIPEQQAGQPVHEKLEALRANLSRIESDAMIVTALDEIAWLLNVRGRDAPYSPFVRSYLLVTRDEVQWFVPAEKVTTPLRVELQKNSVISRIRLRTYDDVWKELKNLSFRRILIPAACEFSPGASQSIVSIFPNSRRIIRPSPVIFLRAVKNEAEIEEMREAGLKESAAFAQFLMFLEDEMQNAANITELELGRKLEQFKLNQSEEYQGQAIPLRIAYGQHGALSSFHPSNNTDMFIGDSSTLVIHSASHYFVGTASVARTLHFGTPSRTDIEIYTLTLAALIKLSRQIFPSDLKPADLDTIVKSRLWMHGLDYDHGTGHGIGSFSNYFESPININRNSKYLNHNLLNGSFITAGPTYFEPGDFGIHLENVLETVSKPTSYLHGVRQSLGFQETTLVPFEEKLIEPALLSTDEVAYINRYHKRVLDEVGNELKKQSRMDAVYWLMKKTKAISPRCSTAISNAPLFFVPLMFLTCLRFL